MVVGKSRRSIYFPKNFRFSSSLLTEVISFGLWSNLLILLHLFIDSDNPSIKCTFVFWFIHSFNRFFSTQVFLEIVVLSFPHILHKLVVFLLATLKKGRTNGGVSQRFFPMMFGSDLGHFCDDAELLDGSGWDNDILEHILSAVL